MPRIVLYARSSCPYCVMAKQLLSAKGQPWQEIDVEVEAGRRAEMERRSGRTTLPQIWIGDVHVGGYDDLSALDAAGELDVLLERDEAGA